MEDKKEDDPLAGMDDFLKGIKNAMKKAEKMATGNIAIKELEMKIEKFGKINFVSRRMSNNRIVLEFQNEADQIAYYKAAKK